MSQCVFCGEYLSKGRWELGYKTCLTCGEQEARKVKHCVAPMHKSNYMLFTDKDLLVGLNNKGGLVR
jgi:predicted  nucleic acid-binding Zn-ribbon protein